MLHAARSSSGATAARALLGHAMFGVAVATMLGAYPRPPLRCGVRGASDSVTSKTWICGNIGFAWPQRMQLTGDTGAREQTKPGRADTARSRRGAVGAVGAAAVADAAD